MPEADASQRVEDFTLSRTQPLQWVKPEHCETLVETVLNAVLPSMN
jgi:propanediol dehydratase small subunit